MIVLLLIGLVLAAFAVTMVARSFIASRLRALDSLGSIGNYGFGGAPIDVEGPTGLRAFVDSLASRIGTTILKDFHFGDEESLRKQLVAAGLYNVSPRMLMGYQLLLGVVLPLAWIWLTLSAGISPALGILGTVFSLMFGWVAPAMWVRQRGDARLYQIDYDMPELIDLLVVTVEAGLSLTAAIQLASGRLKGPLGEELRIAMQEQRMGLPLLQALENFLSRCPTPAVRSFVRAMIQGERLGVSVGQILRSLALEMRKRRRAAAEEKAQKAPLKILFPLIFMIFPAMFVVILGPAIIGIIQALGGK